MGHPFGELLTQYRSRKRGLSQSKIAKRIGYDQAVIARMAQGTRDLTGPSGRERVVRILAALNDEGVLRSLDEANALLAAAKMPPLYAGVALEAALVQAISSVDTPMHALQQFAQTETLSHQHTSHNLPLGLTIFIGREKEIAELTALLQTTRLVTLTGTGGVGKTRLAIALAAQIAEQRNRTCYEVVWMAELASLSNPTLLPQWLLEVLGVQEQPNQTPLSTLIETLHNRKVLLVLDNCEHLIESCAHFVETLLQRCPSVSILATSREPLGIAGELIWQVAPLQTPTASANLTFAELEGFEAVQLFSARAQLVMPDFKLTTHHAAAVQQICAQLDGIPLAIELAAARIKLLSPEEISERLSDRFHLLTSGSRTAASRHQTLQAMLDWSHRLLTPAEQILFRRLSVFVGSWTIEAAESICSGVLGDKDGLKSLEDKIAAQEVLNLLAQLVNKSLVVTSRSSGVTRYSLLETIRQYSMEKLAVADERGALRDQHLNWFLALSEAIGPQLGEIDHLDQVPIRNRLERDLDNIRHALEWAVESKQISKGLRLILAFANLFIARASLRELLSRSKGLVEHRAAPQNTPIQAATYLLIARLYFRLSEPNLAVSCLDQVEAIGVTQQDPGLQAEFLRYRAQQAVEQSDFALAHVFLQQWRSLHLSNHLLGLTEELYTEIDAALEGHLLLDVGDYSEAVIKLTRLHHLVEQRGDKRGFIGLTAVNRMLGYALLHSSRFDEAARHFHASLVGNIALDDKLAIAACMAALAAYALSLEDLYVSAHLFGMSEALQKAIHTPIVPADNRQVQQHLAILRQQLDPVDLDTYWEAGRTMSMEQAANYALNYWPLR